MAGSATFGVNGKFGSLTFFGSSSNQQLRLTKWGLALKADKIMITNTRSPTISLGKTGFSVTTQIWNEYLLGTLDGQLSFEGIYTIEDNSTGPVYNHLLAIGSGSGGTTVPGMVPGTSDADTYGRANVKLIPDDNSFPNENIQGTVVIEDFEITAELEGAVQFKGTATFSGGYTPTTNL
jgi:hypothetical protein